jgi:hypothetical protein
VIRNKIRDKTDKSPILYLAAKTGVWALSAAFLLVLLGCTEPAPPPDPPNIEPNWVQVDQPQPTDTLDTNLASEVLIEPNQPAPPPEPDLTTTDNPQPAKTPVDPPEPNEITIFEPNEPSTSVPDEPPPPEPNEPPIIAIAPDSNEPNVPDSNQTAPQTGDVNKDARAFHDQFAPVFNEYVNDNGFVDYDKLEHNRTELRQLLRKFSALDPNEYNQWSTDDQIAMWINAWNIGMLELLARHYPVESYRFDVLWWPPTSILHIDKRIGGIKKQKLVVMGQQFTFERIEQQIFREKFADPRVFLAISQGCNDGPPLLTVPHYGYKLQEQLNSQITKFIAINRVFRIDHDNNIVWISSMFDPRMYGKDFVPRYHDKGKFQDQKAYTAAALNFMLPRLSQQDRDYLLGRNFRVLFIDFDWRLNDTPKSNSKP